MRRTRPPAHRAPLFPTATLLRGRFSVLHTIVAQRYRTEELLGEGASGSVFRARDLASEQEVALKITPTAADAITEWQAGRRVTAAGVVQLLDVGRDPQAEWGYLCMSLAPGRPLTEWWRAQVEAAPLPPWDLFAAVVAQARAAVGAIHAAGMLHLDLKPAHILIADPGPQVTLLDLGLAQLSGKTRRGLTGTPHYTAPELARGEHPTAAADAFSLGACLYHALTGRPPHEGANSRAILRAASRGEHLPLDQAEVIPPLSLEQIPAPLVEEIETLLAAQPGARLRQPTHFPLEHLRPPFCGREDSLVGADDWLKRRAGGVFRVVGGRGSGRKRFAMEIADRARVQGWRVLEIDGATPWRALLAAARQWCEACLGPLPRALADAAAAPPGAPWEAIHAARSHALVEILRLLAGHLETPLLLLLKEPLDHHNLRIVEQIWAEHPVQDVGLVAISDRAGDVPCARLAPLTRAATRALLAWALQCEPGEIRERVLEAVQRHTRGQPGRIIDLAQRLTPGTLSGLTDAQAAAKVEALISVDDKSILQLLTHLSPGEQALLEAAVVHTLPATPAELQSLLDAPDAKLQSHLEHLTQLGLLRHDAQRRFRPATERVVALVREDLGRVRARRMHQRALRRLAAGSEPIPPFLRARHQLGCGAFDAALDAIEEVVGDAATPPAQAQELTDLALRHIAADDPAYARACVAAANAALASHDAQRAAGHARAAWSHFTTAAAVPAPLPTAATLQPLLDGQTPALAKIAIGALSALGAALVESESAADAIAFLAPLVDYLGSRRGASAADAATLHQSQISLGRALAATGRSEEALPQIEAAINTARRQGSELTVGYDSLALAEALGATRNLVAAGRAAREALEIATRLGAAPLALRATQSCAEVDFRDGRLQEARAGFTAARAAAASWGDTEICIFAELRLAAIASAEHKFDEAITLFDQAMPRVREFGHINVLLNLLASRARVLERLSRIEEAVADLREAIAAAAGAGRILDAAWLRTSLAVDLIRLRRVTAARQTLESVDQALAGVESPAHRLMAEQTWIRLEMHLLRWTEAEAHAARGGKLAPRDPEIALRRIQIACRRGRPDQARTLFDRDQKMIEAAPESRIAEIVTLLKAELLLAEGRATDAATLTDTVLATHSAAQADSFSALAAWISGRSALSRGLLTTADRQLHSAVLQMRALGISEEFPALLDHASALAARSQDAAARDRVLEARAMLEEVPEEAEMLRLLQATEQQIDAARIRAASAAANPNGTSPTPFGTLIHVLEEIAAGESLPDLLPRLLDLTLDLLHGERGILFLVDPPSGELRPHVTRGVDPETVKDAHTWSAGVLNRSRRGELLLHDDAHSAEELSGFESIRRFGILSVAAVPLLEDDLPVGVVYVDNRTHHLAVSPSTRNAFEAMGRIFGRLIRRTAAVDQLRGEANRLHDEREVTRGMKAHYAHRDSWGRVIGGSEPMQALYAHAESILAYAAANGRLPRLLLTGPTGSGKNLLAEEIARRCARGDKPFIQVNCANLGEGTAESELFGHRRGAFTGAVGDKTGWFEEADGGVLFLDEIAEITLELQAKLLRAIDDGRIYRMGETRPRKVDVWLLTATNKSLKDEIAAGRFREDLYYRIAAVEVPIPPLHQRRGDIERLALHFLAQEQGHSSYQLSRGARAALEAYSWPGNLRELKSAIVGAAIRSTDGTIGIAQLPAEIRRSAQEQSLSESDTVESLEAQEAAFYRRVIQKAAENHGANRKHLALALGISTTKLRRLIERYQIPLPKPVRGRPVKS